MNGLPKRRKPQPLGVKEAPQIRCPSHLKFVRGFECSVANSHTACSGKIEAAHIRSGTDGGTSVKPSDCWAIPLCAGHHFIQHNVGETSFERIYKINMKSIAQALWSKSPHRHKVQS